MQTSKYLFAAGVLAAVILPLRVQAGPDTDEQAKMRAALRRALEQPNAPQPAQPAATPAAQPPKPEPAPAPPPPVQPAPAPVTPVAPPPVAATVVVPTPQTFEAVPAPDDAASIARAREAMRKKLQELQAMPAPTPAPSVAAVAPAPAPKTALAPAPQPGSAPVATSSYKPIDAPPSPFSPAQQAKLADLLARYRADAITAQEYHAQRAAIIAAP